MEHRNYETSAQIFIQLVLFFVSSSLEIYWVDYTMDPMAKHFNVI